MIHLAAIFSAAIGAALVAFVGIRVTAGQGRALVATASVAGAVSFAVFLFLRPQSLVLTNLAVLAAAVLVGSGLGLLLTTKAALVSFAVVASVADVYSASRGLTAQISDAYREGGSDLLLLLSVSCRLDGRVQQVVGIGDLVVLGAIFFALSRLGYRGPLVFLAPLGGLLLALVVGLLVGGVSAIPFITAATVCYAAITSPSPGPSPRGSARA